MLQVKTPEEVLRLIETEFAPLRREVKNAYFARLLK